MRGGRLCGGESRKTEMIWLVVALAVALSLTMALAFLLARGTGNSGWVDTIWSYATGVAGAVAALVPLDGGGVLGRQVLVAVLALAWAVRLGSHILARTLAGHDDPRYVQLRKEWGARADLYMFGFLQIQAACALLLALAVMAAARNPAPGWLLTDALGLLLVVAAVVGEGVADRQLAAFRANPANRGRVCEAGLWGVSRHPNYFFEWLGWVAYAVIALGGVPFGYGFGWVALLAPALMYWLLVHASGIPPTEAHMLRSRGDAFRAYQARVNAFWPGPRKASGRGALDRSSLRPGE